MLIFYEALKKNSMKNFYRILLLLLTISICISCGEEEPIINLSCDFEEGRNAVVDIEGSELKCAYGISGYTLYKDSFDAMQKTSLFNSIIRIFMSRFQLPNCIEMS
jgi:hypothetical protein